MPSRFSSSSWKSRLLLVAGGTLVGLLLAVLLLEIALRVVGFRYALFPEKIEFGYPDPELFDSLYVADPDLFWVHEDYHDRLDRARGVDVVFMGDSCTEFGRYDRFLAEMAAERHPGKGFSYLNAGFGGWTSWQGRRQLERDIVHLRPKVITIYFGWNDHWIGFGIEDKRVADIRESSLLYILRDVRVVQLLTGMYIARRNATDGMLKRVSPPDFKRNLVEMVRTAREHGIVPVLLTAPTSHRPGREPAFLANRWLPQLEEMGPLHSQYIEIVREVAREEEVPLCDLAAMFETLPRERVVRELFKMDTIHFVEAGDRQLAEFVYTCMNEMDLLDLILHPGEEFVQIPGRIFPGEVNPPPRVHRDPSLPLRFEIETVRWDDEDRLHIEGHVLSPIPIDYVVVFAGEKNLGIAIYPIAYPEIAEQYPEYEDGFARYLFLRRLDREARQTLDRRGRIELYNGDELMGTFPFELPGG